MLSTVPWGVVRSALHVGRREGDAVWHRRSDRRIPPRETVVKRSVITCQSSRTCAAGQHADAGRHVRAKFASCAQTPSRSAGPALQRGRSEAQNLVRRRAQLHPDKRDGGPARARSEGRSDLARDTAQKPVVNLDLIHQQNALVIGTQIVVSGRRVLAALSSRHLVRHRQASRGVNDPTGQARGHPARAATGSFTPRLAYQHPTPWLRHGRHRAPPDRDDAIDNSLRVLSVGALQTHDRDERFTVVDRVVKANGRGTTYGAPGLSPLSASTRVGFRRRLPRG